MQIDHVHFYTRDAAATSNWLSRNIGFQAIASEQILVDWHRDQGKRILSIRTFQSQ